MQLDVTQGQLCELAPSHNIRSPVKSLVIDLTGWQSHLSLVVCQLSRDISRYEDCKMWLVLISLSFVSQMSVGLLLVKIVSLSIVCLPC